LLEIGEARVLSLLYIHNICVLPNYVPIAMFVTARTAIMC
jgi:hypothetical protein